MKGFYMAIIETALTRLLGIEHPILLAPMGSAAGGRLAAAVTNAGGLGMIGSGYCGDIPPGQPDFLTPYLRAIFATIGIGQLGGFAFSDTGIPSHLNRVPCHPPLDG